MLEEGLRGRAGWCEGRETRSRRWHRRVSVSVPSLRSQHHRHAHLRWHPHHSHAAHSHPQSTAVHPSSTSTAIHRRRSIRRNTPSRPIAPCLPPCDALRLGLLSRLGHELHHLRRALMERESLVGRQRGVEVRIDAWWGVGEVGVGYGGRARLERREGRLELILRRGDERWCRPELRRRL